MRSKVTYMGIGKLLSNRNIYSVLLAVVISFAFVAIMVNGATTISSNINTGGTLTVTGNSTLTSNVFASSTMAVTGQTSFYNQVVLNNASSDPTGVAAGAIYWDTAREEIRVFDGIDWNTVASSTDAAGGLILAGDGQGVRFNTIANGYMALGTTTLPVIAVDSGNAILHINATTSASVPLVIAGIGAFGGDLFNVYNHLQTQVFSLDPMGNASTTMLSTNVIALDALTVSGYATTSGTTGNFDTEGNIVAVGTLTITGTQTFTGALTANGAVTLGDAAGDAIIFTGNASTTNSLSVGTGGLGREFSVGGFATTTVGFEGNVFATTTIGLDTEIGGGGFLGVGTTTSAFSAALGVRGNIHAGSAATTTLSLHTDAAANGTCIQMVSSDGAMVRIFVLNADNALVVEAGPCSGGGS
ncbi:MAG: hypothetical protein Q8R36_02945 [bacterium]|nr:hypothetical protein [bacterium]